jgi:5-methylcytosine-specific restriction endonuclease McrA
VWENVVTSCAPCNLRKGDRTLEEAGMQPIRTPRPPAPALFVTLAAPTIPDRWHTYLAAFS